jgi:hypothetical protein
MQYWTLLLGIALSGCGREHPLPHENGVRRANPRRVSPESMHKKNPRIREEIEVIFKESSKSPYLNGVDPVLMDAERTDAEFVDALSRRMKVLSKASVPIDSFAAECDISLRDGELKLNLVEDTIDNIPHLRIHLSARVRVPGSNNSIVYHAKEVLVIYDDSINDIDWASWLSKKANIANSIIYTGFNWVSLQFGLKFLFDGFQIKIKGEDVPEKRQWARVCKAKNVSNACLIIPPNGQRSRDTRQVIGLVVES